MPTIGTASMRFGINQVWCLAELRSAPELLFCRDEGAKT
jgi:hypothetical protein